MASPANLLRWGLVEDCCCSLCENKGCDTKHILSGCQVALAQGRYTYRHNAVLRKIAHGCQQVINKVKNSNEKKQKAGGIKFVKEGQQVDQKAKMKATGILQEAKDWSMEVDLENKLKFPEDIVKSNLRPDIVMKSSKENILVLIELTSPCEENFEARHTEKMAKYTELAAECRNIGWKVHLFAVEVGARGYVPYSLQQCLRKLGVDWRKTKETRKEAGDCALRCSFWIWIGRKEIMWNPSNNIVNRNERVRKTLKQRGQMITEVKEELVVKRVHVT